MLQRRLSLPLLLSLAVAACAQTGAEFVPLEQGRRGEYEVSFAASGQRVDGRMVARIEGTEAIGGQEFWKLVTVTSGIPGLEPMVSYLRSESGNVYIVSEHQKEEAAEKLYLPRDVRVGTSWSSETPEGVWRYRIEGREAVHMFDRTYEDCLKVVGEGTFASEGKDFSVESVSFFAAGVGEISAVQKLKDLSAGTEVTITSMLVAES